MAHNKYKLLILCNIILALSILSCKGNNDKKRVKEEIMHLYGLYITFPKIISDSNNLVPNIVIYYDSLCCTSCAINALPEWSFLVKYIKENTTSVGLKFIFSPKKTNKKNIYKDLEFAKDSLNYPIIIDLNNQFETLNPQLVHHRKFHIFLLDKNNKIVLIGNPLFNDKLWALYKQTVKKLIANGGILPEEN